MPSSPEVITRSPIATSDRFDTYSMRSGVSPSGADDDAARAVAIDERACPGVAVDDQLHLGGMRRGLVDDPADDTKRRQHRHVAADAVARALVDGDRAERRRRIGGNHPRRHRRRQFRALQLQQLFELLGATGLRVGVLEFDAEAIELQLQGIGARHGVP